MSSNVTINCPLCNSPIVVEPKQLMSGAKFGCSNHQCDAVVSISQESQSTVKTAINELDQLKQHMH